jgi:hypothetical protein
VSVKGGKLRASCVRDLIGTVQRERATGCETLSEAWRVMRYAAATLALSSRPTIFHTFLRSAVSFRDEAYLRHRVHRFLRPQLNP